MEHRYRNRIEILRDFLHATRVSGRRTRIIGLANLNPRSFDYYLRFSLAYGLVKYAPDGIRVTPRAELVLDSIQRVMSQSLQLESAVQQLHQELAGELTAGGMTGGSVRFVPRLLWIPGDPSPEAPSGPSRYAEIDPVSLTAELVEPWLSRSGGRGPPDPPTRTSPPAATPSIAEPPPRPRRRR